MGFRFAVPNCQERPVERVGIAEGKGAAVPGAEQFGEAQPWRSA